MSEKKISILICDLPHKNEVKAVDSLFVRSALGGREKGIDVCTVHQQMVLGNGARKVRSEPAERDQKVEQIDRIPAGWVDTNQAAELLDVHRSRVLSLAKDGTLSGRMVMIPGRRGRGIYIFERPAVQAVARARAG